MARHSLLRGLSPAADGATGKQSRATAKHRNRSMVGLMTGISLSRNPAAVVA